MATPPPEITHENGGMQIDWAIFSKENGGIHIKGEKRGVRRYAGPNPARTLRTLAHGSQEVSVR